MVYIKVLVLLVLLIFGPGACRKPGIFLPVDAATSVQRTGTIPDSLQNLVCVNPHKMPVFPGGEAALLRFVHEQVTYSPRCSEYIGASAISFEVQADGSVSDLQILKLAHPSLEPMILEMFAQMPHWTPGEVSGKPARTRMTLPIRVCLQ